MLSLGRWLAHRPLWFLHAIGGWLGWIAYAASPVYRARFRAHVRQAGVAPALVRPAIAEAGRMLAELPFLWLRPATAGVPAPVTWLGTELLHAAHARGRGVVMLTPHLGCFEVTAQSYAERFASTLGPVTVMYRPARKPWLRELVARSRDRPGLSAAPAALGGLRQMIRALRRGEAVGLLPDQVPPEGMGVWAPFFDRPAYTMTLAARLIQQTDATPLLIWGERLPRGAGYVIRVSALAETLPVGDAAQAESAAIVNRAMEQLIRQCPQQYLWGYHRYKAPRAPAP